MKEPNTHLDSGGGGGNENNNLATSKIGDGFDDISSPYLDYLDPGQISPDTSRKPCFAHPLLRVFGKKFKKDKGGYSVSKTYNKTIGETEQSPHTSSSSTSAAPSEMNRSSKNINKLQRVQSERLGTGSSGLKLTQSYKRINDHGKKVDEENMKNKAVKDKDQKSPDYYNSDDPYMKQAFTFAKREVSKYKLQECKIKREISIVTRSSSIHSTVRPRVTKREPSQTAPTSLGRNSGSTQTLHTLIPEPSSNTACTTTVRSPEHAQGKINEKNNSNKKSSLQNEPKNSQKLTAFRSITRSLASSSPVELNEGQITRSRSASRHLEIGSPETSQSSVVSRARSQSSSRSQTLESPITETVKNQRQSRTNLNEDSTNSSRSNSENGDFDIRDIPHLGKITDLTSKSRSIATDSGMGSGSPGLSSENDKGSSDGSDRYESGSNRHGSGSEHIQTRQRSLSHQPRGRLENTTTRRNADSRSRVDSTSQSIKNQAKRSQSFKKQERPNIKVNLPKRSGSMNYGLNRPSLKPLPKTNPIGNGMSNSTSLNNLLSKLEFFKIIQAKKNGSIPNGTIHKSQSVVIRPWDRTETKKLTPSEKFANTIKKHQPLLVPVKKMQRGKDGGSRTNSSSTLSLNSSDKNVFKPPKHCLDKVAFDTMSLAPNTTQNPMYKMNRLKIQSEGTGTSAGYGGFSGGSGVGRTGSLLSRKKSLSGNSSNYVFDYSSRDSANGSSEEPGSSSGSENRTSTHSTSSSLKSSTSSSLLKLRKQMGMNEIDDSKLKRRVTFSGKADPVFYC